MFPKRNVGSAPPTRTNKFTKFAVLTLRANTQLPKSHNNRLSKFAFTK